MASPSFAVLMHYANLVSNANGIITWCKDSIACYSFAVDKQPPPPWIRLFEMQQRGETRPGFVVSSNMDVENDLQDAEDAFVCNAILTIQSNWTQFLQSSGSDANIIKSEITSEKLARLLQITLISLTSIYSRSKRILPRFPSNKILSLFRHVVSVGPKEFFNKNELAARGVRAYALNWDAIDVIPELDFNKSSKPMAYFDVAFSSFLNSRLCDSMMQGIVYSKRFGLPSGFSEYTYDESFGESNLPTTIQAFSAISTLCKWHTMAKIAHKNASNSVASRTRGKIAKHLPYD